MKHPSQRRLDIETELLVRTGWLFVAFTIIWFGFAL